MLASLEHEALQLAIDCLEPTVAEEYPEAGRLAAVRVLHV
jgi:hypothetical protein